jgi:hypothetical protein
MSHFIVLVSGEDYEAQLTPFQENDCKKKGNYEKNYIKRI